MRDEPTYTRNGAQGYLESASEKKEAEEEMMEVRLVVSEPKKHKFMDTSLSFSFPSSARRYNTIDIRPADETGKKCGRLELCAPRASASMTLSSAAA